MIPDAAVEAAARAIFGMRGREWTVMEELTCTSQAKRALEAATPHMLAKAGVLRTFCTETHGHPDPHYVCLAPSGHGANTDE